MSGEANPRNPASGNPYRQERRASPRLPSNLKLYCYPLTAGLSDRRLVRVRDVSRNGIAVLTDRRWEPGTILVVELPVPEGTDNIHARIIHTTPHLGGLFLIGCALDIGFTEAQLMRLTS